MTVGNGDCKTGATYSSAPAVPVARRAAEGQDIEAGRWPRRDEGSWRATEPAKSRLRAPTETPLVGRSAGPRHRRLAATGCRRTGERAKKKRCENASSSHQRMFVQGKASRRHLSAAQLLRGSFPHRFVTCCWNSARRYFIARIRSKSLRRT